jgi:large subunit ribosomal protein L7e
VQTLNAFTGTSSNDPYSPQSIVIKQRRDAELKEKAEKIAAKIAAASATKKEEIAKRAEQYEKEYAQAEADLVAQRREAHANGHLFAEAEGRLAIVIRIRGINQTSPKVRKTLQLLRLRQIHNAVFVRLTKATMEMLRLVEPYIAYGYPNLKTVRALIYKRGYAKLNHQRVPITENAQIEKVLGKFGIMSTEDLVHEIYTVGPHFKQAANFLWPFKLNSPTGGFSKKLRHFNEGGDYGNHEVLIGKLVNRMI